jgi:hypothetical protein
MSSVSWPGKGEIRTQITDAASSVRMTYLTGKIIFYEGGHDEYQHDNADDATTPMPHMIPLPIVLCIMASFIRRPLPRRRHRSVGVLIHVTEQFDFGRVLDGI